MCGIAGILTAESELELRPAIRQMLCAQQHRGPDDNGCAEIALPHGYRLALAHTRLAILDLSSAGHQPMQDTESGSWIVYNGEVYNHEQIRARMMDCPFRSTSDTETILKSWARQGEQALSAMRGMFAFALYDGQRRQLWLVRDRLGIKPLYVCQVKSSTWVFASELRALLASGLVDRRLDPAAVDSYLAFGAVTAPWTLLAGVENVMPGETWRFDLKQPTLVPERKRYWRPRFCDASAPVPTRAEALERLRPVLLEAVGLRMLSDVPVGMFLSGGIDSSSVVGALVSQGFELRTFSIVFAERRYDESEHSRLVARQFDTDHAELSLRPAKVVDEFDEAVGSYDQPSIDGLNTYFISQAARQAGVKVALSGMGGDELFAGYPYFLLSARLEQSLPRLLARFVHGVARRLAPRSIRTIKLGAVLANGASRLSRYAIYRQVMAPELRHELLARSSEPFREPLPPEVLAELEAAVAPLDAVNAHSLLELSLYMPNMLLRDMDQMSMAHSLELRDPLLDHVLVETAAGLPGSLKLAPGRQSRSKALLVDALPAALPNRVVRRPKMGFVFPWERWLRAELRPRVAALLSDADTLKAAGLSPAAVQTLWNAFLASKPGVRYTDILALVHLLHWVRQHRLAVSRRPDIAQPSWVQVLT